ncbi:hypothetical protein DMH01_14835 [Amycolatopsis sp. WAC 04182]|uniref:hypothetical protein n=1 Tax=Amycolatopsis sp. WAC 04182 TaxID=2203198 RepID=UPI000F76BE8A|nr:hypothetical protein [Amycolatopsis sp. WAC 04182]RSN60574.1 hypothetical protein DMH01_14835 [Amycolatopsis sp. WAC 04182]
MNEAIPHTAGELRRSLVELGNPGTADPALGDDDPLMEGSRGGQTEDEVPGQSRLAVLDAYADVCELLAVTSPLNSLLRHRWAEVDLLVSGTGGGS